MPETANAIHAYLTAEGKAGWKALADENGVSTTALMEVIGKMFGDEIKANNHVADGLYPEWVKAARKVDAGRRRRS